MDFVKQGPAAKYSHEGDEPINVNMAFGEQISFGQRSADVVARIVGSWAFIIFQSIALLIWMAANIFLAYQYETNPTYFNAWDPYPFILLNLLLSFEAAYTGPIIMMSQNRQNAKDRLAAELDFEVNKKSEEEIKVIMDHLVYQDKLILKIIEKQEITK
ncbi:putative membrane protein [Sporomusaceae bacterium BoRhaA]|uniref:DUF1003 domain-containing protein n=1 Tax=Pelorhabdus rhamnosifermentans TaxID=2772457 RepID=UPI001C06423E|nr:DUF1003 domain-containing protein [Pelorhabdus rhamnosifermentans]MBU2702896.1 putative membrane protein [Pelorhabdus rhamnosifermentans]